MRFVSDALLIVSGVYLALGLIYLRFWWAERAADSLSRFHRSPASRTFRSHGASWDAECGHTRTISFLRMVGLFSRYGGAYFSCVVCVCSATRAQMAFFDLLLLANTSGYLTSRHGKR
jgi:hypothetical protein